MLGAMVAPTLGLWWQKAGVLAECFTALVAGAAVFVAAKALKGEGRLLGETQKQVRAANEQVKVSQQQIGAMQAQLEVSQRQVETARQQLEASVRPVLVVRQGREKIHEGSIVLANIGSGPALAVTLAHDAKGPEEVGPIAEGEELGAPNGIFSQRSDAEIRYEDVDGTRYVTKVNRAADGRCEQTVQRLPEAQRRGAAAT